MLVKGIAEIWALILPFQEACRLRIRWKLSIVRDSSQYRFYGTCTYFSAMSTWRGKIEPHSCFHWGTMIIALFFLVVYHLGWSDICGSLDQSQQVSVVCSKEVEVRCSKSKLHYISLIRCTARNRCRISVGIISNFVTQHHSNGLSADD